MPKPKDFRNLIINRINNFWGYGNINSDIWFIGMEEGFGGNPKDLKERFKKTKNKAVIDIQDGMKGIMDHMEWFKSGSSIQRTWSKLIRILLVMASDKNITNDEIREFQRDKFGRRGGNHCILEFMPLPCHSVKDWPYSQYGIDSRNKIIPYRIERLKGLIEKHKPKAVIFYSFGYLKYWKGLIGCNLKKKTKYLQYCKVSHTTFFVIPHPTAQGITNNQWMKIAKDIRKISNLRL